MNVQILSIGKEKHRVWQKFLFSALATEEHEIKKRCMGNLSLRLDGREYNWGSPAMK